MKFSVLMSVYHRDNPKFLKEAIESVLDQTILPNEIVVVKDGQLTKELELILDDYVSANRAMFKIIPLEKNRGLGLALREGVKHCSHELIARMDSDDICLNDRFEKQLKIFEKSENLDVVGGWIAEFDETINRNLIERRVPKNTIEIKEYFKKRNPLNHVTVMMKKESLLKAGSYKDFHQHEDYYLWARMLKNEMKLINLQEVLVYVRTGSEMYGRRGGLKYFKHDIAIQKKFLDENLTGSIDAAKYILYRMPVRFLPNSLRSFFYKKMLRKAGG